MSKDGRDTPLNMEIIGLVKNAKYSDVKKEVPPLFFKPYRQDETIGNINFYVRTAGDLTALLNSLPKAIARLDANLPVECSRLGAPGTLNFRVLASYLYDLIIDRGLGGNIYNDAGQFGPTAACGGFNTSPKWQANAFLTESTGPFSGTVQVRYVGPGRFTTTSPRGVAI